MKNRERSLVRDRRGGGGGKKLPTKKAGPVFALQKIYLLVVGRGKGKISDLGRRKGSRGNFQPSTENPPITVLEPLSM